MTTVMQGRFTMLPSESHIDCVPNITNMHYASLNSQWKIVNDNTRDIHGNRSLFQLEVREMKKKSLYL